MEISFELLVPLMIILAKLMTWLLLVFTCCSTVNLLSDGDFKARLCNRFTTESAQHDSLPTDRNSLRYSLAKLGGEQLAMALSTLLLKLQSDLLTIYLALCGGS